MCNMDVGCGVKVTFRIFFGYKIQLDGSWKRSLNERYRWRDSAPCLVFIIPQAARLAHVLNY